MPDARSAEHGGEPATNVGSSGAWTPSFRTVSVETGAVAVGSPMVTVFVPAEPSLHADDRLTKVDELRVGCSTAV